MEILIRLGLGFAGVLVHCLKNYDSLTKDAKALKINFSFRDYLEKDWLSISLSTIAVLIWPFLFDEAANKYVYLENVVRWSFFFVGLLGTYGIQAFAGRGRSAIRAIAKEKTETLEILKDAVIFSDAPGGDPVQPDKGI